MTSLLAGTVAHGARGGRGVSTSYYRRRVSPGLSGTPRHSPELPGNGSHDTMSRVVTGSCHRFCWYCHRISQLETSFIFGQLSERQL